MKINYYLICLVSLIVHFVLNILIVLLAKNHYGGQETMVFGNVNISTLISFANAFFVAGIAIFIIYKQKMCKKQAGISRTLCILALVLNLALKMFF